MSFAEWTTEETRDFLIGINGRLGALEFLVEQIMASQHLAGDEPIKRAREFRSKAAVIIGRSTAPSLPPEGRKVAVEVMAGAVDRLLARVEARLIEVSGGAGDGDFGPRTKET